MSEIYSSTFVRISKGIDLKGGAISSGSGYEQVIGSFDGNKI
jgi:hypothetical protein